MSRPLRPPCLIALAALTLGVAAQGLAIDWVRNPDPLVAASSDRPLFLFFHDESDRDSRRMTTWTFTDPLVPEALTAVTPVFAEPSVLPALAAQFDVIDTPALLLITPQGEVIARHGGPLEAEPLVEWLTQALAEHAAATSGVTDSPDASLSSHQSPAALPSRPLPATVPHFVHSGAVIEPRHHPARSIALGDDIPVQVIVPHGADRVTVHHRTPGVAAFDDIVLSPHTFEIHHAVIPAEAITREGVEYYITVTRQGQSVTLPIEGPGLPHRVGVH